MSHQVPSLLHSKWPPPHINEDSSRPPSLQSKGLAGLEGSYRVDGLPSKDFGKLMLRAEISTIGDSQDVSSIYSVGSSAPRDRLLDSKCKCGAKEQLIACKARHERLTKKAVVRRRCAVNRGKLAAAGQAALRMLSDELSIIIIEAEGNCKDWMAAVEREERVYGDLETVEESLASREGSIPEHRTELESLRNREAAVQEELRSKTQELACSLRRARSELRVERESEDKLRTALLSARRKLSSIREKLEKDQSSLEVARTNIDVYNSVIEEVPGIIADLEIGEKGILRESREYSERLVSLMEEISRVDDHIDGLRRSKVKEINDRKEYLQGENRELDRLSERLNAIQRYVAEHQQGRDGNDTSRSKLSDGDDELIEMENEIEKNARQIKVNERELECMMGRSNALRKRLKRIEERSKVESRRTRRL